MKQFAVTFGRGSCLVVAVTLWSFFAGGQSAAGDPPPLKTAAASIKSEGDHKKLSPPDAPSLEVARRRVSEAYGDRLASGDPKALAAAIAEVIAEGQRADGSTPAERYALLESARTAGIRLGDLRLVAAAIDGLDKQFVVDATTLKFDSAKQLTKRPVDRATLAAFYLRLAATLGDDSLELRSKAVAAAEGLATRIKDVPTRDDIRRQCAACRSAIADATRVQSLAATLADNPEDAEANRAVGWHRAIHLEDWSSALPLLVKGDDTGLKALAESELKNPSELKRQLQLADGWWTVADRRGIRPDESAALRRHAGEWYKIAKPHLTGLQATLIEKRLIQINISVAQNDKPPRDFWAPADMGIASKGWTDVTTSVDVGKAGPDTCRLDHDGLHLCGRKGEANRFDPACVNFVKNLPEEYDIQMDFTVEEIESSGEVAEVFEYRGERHSLVMGGDNNRQTFLGDTRLVYWGEHLEPYFKPGSRHLSMICVRRTGVLALLDGVQIFSNPMKLCEPVKVPSGLELEVRDRIIVHSLRYRPIERTTPLQVKAAPSARDSVKAELSLFNGHDLSGWRGNELWSVRDGAITGEVPIGYKGPDTCLVWEGGEPENFELEMKFRVIAGNSGIQYRSQYVVEDLFNVGGYQADMAADHYCTGNLYDECGVAGFRRVLAQTGEVVTFDSQGKRESRPLPVSRDALIRTFHTRDTWNDYLIIADSSHLVHKINGSVVLEVTDDDPHALKRGLIGMNMLVREPCLVQFKDIRLRNK